jgi:hypothetical protein
MTSTYEIKKKKTRLTKKWLTGCPTDSEFVLVEMILRGRTGFEVNLILLEENFQRLAQFHTHSATELKYGYNMVITWLGTTLGYTFITE